MKRFFDNELETFRTNLVRMGETAVRQLRDSMQALADSDLRLAERVVAADDELDQLELRIDEEAVRYLNLRSPIASELRLLIVAMKASHDLERVGDETTNIARRVMRLAAEPPLERYVDLPRMANIASEMLRDALQCFLQVDEERALAVVRRDAEVDALNRQISRELTHIMGERPDAIPRALELMFISKSIERIADHATNLAEEMIYLGQGRDIRHAEELKKNPDASASGAA